MAGSEGVQETTRGTLPTTLTFRPEHARIEVICPSRQVVDFDKVGQSKTRQNANRFYLENGFGTSIMAQFVVAIKDKETNEFWNCQMRNKQRKLVINNGAYYIDVKISPNGLVCFPLTDQNQNQLPHYQGNVKCVLPVEEEPITYHVKIKLYKNGSNGKTLLHCVKYLICTHERNHDVFDYREGRSITEVERPQLKIKKTGILEEVIGRRIIMYFQNLGDNGLYEQFYAKQRQLRRDLESLGKKYSEAYFKDLELSVVLEESSMLFGQNKMVECEDTAMRVIESIMETNTPNGPFLMAKAYYILSAIYRQRGDFVKSKEHLEISTELLEAVVVCEETAVNQYNWAALLAEKSAKGNLSLCEKKDADYRFENAQLHWSNQTQSDTIRCPMKVKARQIIFNLKTSRQRCPDLRNEEVSEEDLAKAAQAIQYVECNLLRDSSKRHQVTYFIAKSDYLIRRASMRRSITPEVRKADAKMADSILKSALAIAEELSLGKEIEGIEDRLEKIAINLLDTPYQRRSPRVIVQATREPVERDDESLAELLRELARQAPEIATEQGVNVNSCQAHSSRAIMAATRDPVEGDSHFINPFMDELTRRSQMD